MLQGKILDYDNYLTEPIRVILFGTVDRRKAFYYVQLYGM
jgi:hypothetical protein